MRTAWILLAACLPLSGCFLFQALTGENQQQTPAAEPEPQPQYDPMQPLRDARAAARATPTDANLVAAYAQALSAFAEQREQAEVEWTASVAEIRTMIDGVVPTSVPQVSAGMLYIEYQLVELDGTDMQALLEVANEGFAMFPDLLFGPLVIDAHEKAGTAPADIASACGDVYAKLTVDKDRFAIIERCLAIQGLEGKREKTLKFVDKKTWKAYDAHAAEQEAEAARLQAEYERAKEQKRQQELELEREREREMASASSNDSWGSSGGGSSSSGGGSASGPVSVTIRSECGRTVKVFFGKNTFSSGTQSTISSNSRQSVSMKPGDVVWILDDSGKEVSSFSASSSTREATITSSCTSWSVR